MMGPNPNATNTFNINAEMGFYTYFVYGNINGMKSMEECTVPVKITCGAANIANALPEAGTPDPSGDTLAKIFANKIPVPSK